MNSQYLQKNKLPDSPGVYFFKDSSDNVLYIGRATSLRDRVRSYFGKDLAEIRGPLIVNMIAKATFLDYQKTDSVLEAIILEANLIKKYQPKYNTDEKDDKSFNYVVITKEDFPQILVIRKNNLDLPATSYKLQAIFGPFPNSNALREALKFIRKIFPYRDEKCKLCIFLRDSASILRFSAGCKPCFNRHLGLCPGVCAGEISKKDYAKTINYITRIFEGKKKSVLYGLEREMKILAKDKNFEKAGEIRNKIFALTHIRDVAFIKKQDDANIRMYTNDTNKKQHEDGKRFDLSEDSRSNLEESFRIEAYDVAHFSGKNTRGVMVVMENGEFIKKEYRTFIIKTAKNSDDIGALAELLNRRFVHKEWNFPNIAVIDGGIGQLNAGKKIIKKYSQKTGVFSVVKDDRHKAREILGKNGKMTNRKDIIRLNAEAHRFALGNLRRSFRKNWLV